MWLHKNTEKENQVLAYALLNDQSKACLVKDSTLKNIASNDHKWIYK